jgi:iron-sulfur cluster assembly protein
MAIVELTDAAIDKMTALLTADATHTGIRLGVLGGGCAGLQYDMKPVESAATGDFVEEHGDAPRNQVKLYIHPVAAAYLKGTRIDYADTLMDGGFKFINPNATNTCGCGTSFGV